MRFYENNKLLFWLYGVLGLGVILSLNNIEGRPVSTNRGFMPVDAFGEWRLIQKPENPGHTTSLTMQQPAYIKTYRNGTDLLWYAGVESLRGHRNQHRPEICYIGNGWGIEKKWKAKFSGQVGVVPVTLMLLKKNSELRLVAYWFYNGKIFTGNYFHRVAQHAWDDIANVPYSAWTFHRLSLPT